VYSHIILIKTYLTLSLLGGLSRKKFASYQSISCHCKNLATIATNTSQNHILLFTFCSLQYAGLCT